MLDSVDQQQSREARSCLTKLFDSHAITRGLQGKTPIATKNVPIYCTHFEAVEISMIYPTIAVLAPANIKTPLRLNLSEKWEIKRTVKKPHMFGGTLNSCVIVELYPRLLMMVGKKSE